MFQDQTRFLHPFLLWYIRMEYDDVWNSEKATHCIAQYLFIDLEYALSSDKFIGKTLNIENKPIQNRWAVKTNSLNLKLINKVG